MDKKLLKAYIRTIVEEEVERVLPKMLKEQLQGIDGNNLVSESTTRSGTTKQSISRNELASLLGISRDGDTLRATTSGLRENHSIPGNVPNYVEDAITRDYSALMKAMNKKR